VLGHFASGLHHPGPRPRRVPISKGIQLGAEGRVAHDDRLVEEVSRFGHLEPPRILLFPGCRQTWRRLLLWLACNDRLRNDALTALIDADAITRREKLAAGRSVAEGVPAATNTPDLPSTIASTFNTACSNGCA